MLFAGPHQTSVSFSAIAAPVGAIIPYNGTVASVSGLEGWELCDGAGGRPDIRDRYIVGADGTFIKGSSGGLSIGQITGTSTTEGSHTFANFGPGSSPGSGYRGGAAGDHNHAISGDMDHRPPSRELIFITATAKSSFPTDAIVFVNDGVAPGGTTTIADLQDRFALGVAGDSRANVGADTRTLTLNTATAGEHLHPALRTNPSGSGQNHVNHGGGGHVHPQWTENVSIEKPPYLALLAVSLDGSSGAFDRLVVGYDGDLGMLPDGWTVCDGTGGAPDLQGRFPIGAGGALTLGETGGGVSQAHNGGAVPSVDAAHTHDSGSGNGGPGDHGYESWVHSHSGWSGTIDTLPPYYAVDFIMFTA